MRSREDDGAGHRHQRLQELIFEELRALMRDDISDPDLVDIEITAVVLSVDYRHARVHYVKGNARALERATPFLRARLADAIDMKRIPDLRFISDGT